MTQDRQPVLLVHGLSASARWWRAVDLGDRDLRHAHPLRLEAAQRSVVIGHSLGGLAAAQLAVERPECVAALVLVAPVGAPHPLLRYVGGLAREARASRPDLLRVVAGDALRFGPVSLTRGALRATRGVFVGAIEAPTLIVWGEHDRLVPPSLAAFWQSAVPGARLELIRGAGHVPMLDAPSAFGEVVRHFLDELGV